MTTFNNNKNNKNSNRMHKQALTIGLLLSYVASTAAARGSSIEKTVTAAAPLSPDADEIANDGFKENEDWWKDPFAMFDDTDMEEEGDDLGTAFNEEPAAVTPTEPEVSAEPLGGNDYMQQEEELLFMEEVSEPVFEAPPVVEAPPAPPVVPKPTRAEKKAAKAAAAPPKAPPAARVVVHPLVEAAQVASTPVDNTATALTRTTNKPATTMQVAPVLPAVRKLGTILGALPFVQVLASFAFVKVVQPVLDQRQGQATAAAALAKENADDGEFEDEMEEEEEEHKYASHQKVKRGGGAVRPPKTGWFKRLFGDSNTNVERLPPARELMDQVEYLQREVDTLRNEKESVEREYEKTSWQLQETQNEHANLQSTTNYLKVQLRDNQEVMDRAVRAERRKAKEELTKMKEAMLQVLQRERQELRAKMVRQTKEVQAKMRNHDEAIAT